MVNIACVVALGWRGWTVERANQALHVENARLREEHRLAAIEIVSLRKTNKSLHDHGDRMGERAKQLAIELRGSDGTAQTGIWPHRKVTVWHGLRVDGRPVGGNK